MRMLIAAARRVWEANRALEWMGTVWARAWLPWADDPEPGDAWDALARKHPELARASRDAAQRLSESEAWNRRAQAISAVIESVKPDRDDAWRDAVSRVRLGILRRLIEADNPKQVADILDREAAAIDAAMDGLR